LLFFYCPQAQQRAQLVMFANTLSCAQPSDTVHIGRLQCASIEQPLTYGVSSRDN